VWRSEDAGGSWQPAATRIGAGVQAFLFHPTDPSTVLAGTLDGVYGSTDGGGTWQPLRTGLPPRDPTRHTAPVAVLSGVPGRANAVFAGLGIRGSPRDALNLGHLYRSDTWGERWELVGFRFGRIRDLAFSPADPRCGAMATSLGVFLTRSGGSAWSRSLEGLPAVGARSVAALPGRKPAFVAAIEDGRLFRFRNEPRTWEPWETGLPEKAGVTALATFEDEGGAVLAGLARRGGGVWFRAAGGEAWRELKGLKAIPSPYAADHAIEGMTARQGLLAWSSRNAFYLPQQEQPWRAFVARRGTEWSGSGLSLLDATALSFSPLDAALFAVISRNGAWFTRNGGRTFAMPGPGLPARFRPHDAVFSRGRDEQVLMWESTGGGPLPVFAGTNRGTGWRQLFTVPMRRLHAVLPPGDDPEVHVVLGDRRVLRSTTGGRTWQHVLLLPPSEHGGRFTVDPANPRRVLLAWGGAEGGLWESLDYGRSWRRLFPAIRAVRGRAGITDRGEVIVCAGSAVWRWNRTAWVKLTERSLPARDLAVVGGKLVIAIFAAASLTDPREVWASADYGRSWHPLARGLPGAPAATIAASPADPQLTILGSAGGGFFRLSPHAE
jgi:photosystem II stability/assembly factor-like uncharacterized protein